MFFLDMCEWFYGLNRSLLLLPSASSSSSSPSIDVSVLLLRALDLYSLYVPALFIVALVLPLWAIDL